MGTDYSAIPLREEKLKKERVVKFPLIILKVKLAVEIITVINKILDKEERLRKNDKNFYSIYYLFNGRIYYLRESTISYRMLKDLKLIGIEIDYMESKGVKKDLTPTDLINPDDFIDLISNKKPIKTQTPPTEQSYKSKEDIQKEKEKLIKENINLDNSNTNIEEINEMIKKATWG